MNQTELVSAFAEKANLKKTDAAAFISTLSEIITEELVNDNPVKLSFGSLIPTVRAARTARTGRNPRTGEPLEIPAKPESRTIKFKPTAAFKTELN